MKQTIMQALRAFYGEETGQDLVEYSLLCALLITAAVAISGSFGDSLKTAFTNIGTRLTTGTEAPASGS